MKTSTKIRTLDKNFVKLTGLTPVFIDILDDRAVNTIFRTLDKNFVKLTGLTAVRVD
jgi:hypothetical protein